MNSVIQGSDEWMRLRSGKFTASNFKPLMSKQTTAGYQNLLWDVAIERMTGAKAETYCSPAMQRGIDLEPEARRAYEDRRMVSVTETGFVLHPELDYVSCSPDGLVEDGLLEIKCPNAANHGKALLKDQHAKDYKWQLQGQMWVCEKPWVDMVSYHPDFPADLQLAIVRVERDEDMIAELQARCIAANDEVVEILGKLKEIRK